MTDAKFVETTARIAESGVKGTEPPAMIASLTTEVRTLKWICGLGLALFGMVVPVMVALVLHGMSAERSCPGSK